MKFSGKAVLLGTAALLALGLAILAASALLLPREYASQQTVERSFSIDEDFTNVRKILVRTDALKRIIAMTGTSAYLDQSWSALGGGLESLNPLDLHWRLELHGTLKVRTLDEYVGRNEVTLRQNVNIDPDQLHSDVELQKGSERLLDYEMTTLFTRDSAGQKTRVTQRLTQKILTDAPWFAHGIADRRVRRSAETALENQEQAIRRVIEGHRHKRWLLPLR